MSEISFITSSLKLLAVSVGVEHDSQSVADASGWKVVGESGYDSAVVSVSLANSAPDDLEAKIFTPIFTQVFKELL